MNEHQKTIVFVWGYIPKIDTLSTVAAGYDLKQRFSLVFNRYPDTAPSVYEIIFDKDLIVSTIEKLLEIENIHHTEGRKDLIKHDIIQSFGQMLEKGQVRPAEKEKILSFVEKQMHCSSPKTRQAVKEFLEKWKK